MRWTKRGLIFDPTGRAAWMATHAADPVPRRFDTHRYRIYCTGRDERGRGQIGYFEIDLRRPTEVLAFSAEPVIALGPLGAFDDSGVVNACIVDHRGREYHFYSGLTLGVTVPFYFFVALAVSEDGGRTVRKWSRGPLLPPSDVDPFLTGSPCVLVEGGKWRMWYTSGVRWTLEDGKPRHYYHVKYAESADGTTWTRTGHVCLDFHGDEHVIARPCVIKDADRYRMWYSYRGPSYRIGYAESDDGLHWTRKDEDVGIDVSAAGWDAQMVEYAWVFDHEGQRYMLYNGNDYGKTGIGLAVLD
jgi:hypothetical protein